MAETRFGHVMALYLVPCDLRFFLGLFYKAEVCLTAAAFCFNSQMSFVKRQILWYLENLWVLVPDK